jgi:hypothetical protein
MIGWIVAVGLLLLFPVQIIIIYLNSLCDFGIELPTELLNNLSIPLVSLAVGIMGIRTFEKLGKGEQDVRY